MCEPRIRSRVITCLPLRPRRMAYLEKKFDTSLITVRVTVCGLIEVFDTCSRIRRYELVFRNISNVNRCQFGDDRHLLFRTNHLIYE